MYRPAIKLLRPGSCFRPADIQHILGPRRSFFSAAAAADPANKTQVYLSRTRDPLLNLSVEHRLLQITPADSTVLVLYVNAPSVVIGRNQNPWLEVNLSRLADVALRPARVGWTGAKDNDDGGNDDDGDGGVATSGVRLVRRRSGGGTVFHDGGNVNFGVICPPAAFDRDKHAEMVVRAVRGLGTPRGGGGYCSTARVNARHDIVVDSDDDNSSEKGATFKVSGSAYKLTRLRSLHHGTCLLQSPNLASMSALLRSPAEAYVKARGVDSVRSRVRNLGIEVRDFECAVVDQFCAMYGEPHVMAEYGDEVLSSPESGDDKIRAGYEELQSPRWTYGQTPHFSFSTHPHEQDPRPRPSLPFHVRFEARHGLLERFEMDEALQIDTSSLLGTYLHEIDDWTKRLAQAGLNKTDAVRVGTWMNEVLGTEFTSMRSLS